MLAAGLGNYPGAQFALGDLYFHGRGVPHSYGEAVGWFRKAARTGHPVAQYLLGLMFKEGWGVDQDAVEAFKWFTLAIRKEGQVSAADPRYDPVKEREALLLSMNRSQIERGDRLVEAWGTR
ncbi:MAG: tetratricopeptide repeat protein [Rhodospirillaceae bacterium]